MTQQNPPYFSATSLDTRWCYAFVAGLGLISWNYIPDSGKWDDSGEYRQSGEGESLGNQGVAENSLNIQVKVGIVIEVGAWKRLRVTELTVNVEVSSLERINENSERRTEKGMGALISKYKMYGITTEGLHHDSLTFLCGEA